MLEQGGNCVGMMNAKRQKGATGTPITKYCSPDIRKNVLLLTSGLFVGFSFVTPTVSLMPLKESPNSGSVSLLP